MCEVCEELERQQLRQRQEISGLALSSIVKRRMLTMSERQEKLYNAVNWIDSLKGDDEPDDLAKFADSLTQEQLVTLNDCYNDLYASVHYEAGTA
jgi:hypothetical protein